MLKMGECPTSPLKERNAKMQSDLKVYLRVEQSEDGKIKLSQVIKFKSDSRVEIPINRDGSIKWFDDSQLIKRE